VNRERHTGVSLLAAGWTRIGEAAGRGRFPQAGASFPAAAIAGHYRMLEQPPESPVTVENLPAVHRGRTRERIAARSTVLPVQDGTDLNLAAHPRGQGLGIVGRNGNSEGMPGLHLHGTPAVAGNGIPIGLTRLEFDAPEPRPEASRGAAGSRTGRWLRALQDASGIAAGVQCVSVMDREADIYGLFELRSRPGNLDLPVRAKHDRSPGPGSPSLFESIRKAPVQAQLRSRRSAVRNDGRRVDGRPGRYARHDGFTPTCAGSVSRCTGIPPRNTRTRCS